MNKKTHFTNKTFYWILILLLGFNLPAQLRTIFSGGIMHFSETLLSSVLFVLVIIKHQYAKLGILIWIVLFAILKYAYELVVILIGDGADDFAYANRWVYLAYFAPIIIAVVILKYTNSTVQIINIEDAEQC